MRCHSACCFIDGLYRTDRPVLQMEPDRFHRWLLAHDDDEASSRDAGQLAANRKARRTLADGSLAVRLQPTKVDLKRMQSYSRWKVSMQLNKLLDWFQPSLSGSKRVVAIRQLEPLPPRFDAALKDAMPYLRAYFPCLDLRLLPDYEFLASRPDLIRKEIKGSIRLEAGSVLRCLLSAGGPAAHAADLQIGVCHADLYPGPDMLGPGQSGAFILGQSSAMHRTAVVCFGRGSSAPIDSDAGLNEDGAPLNSANWRVRKVLSHELGHLLGLDHCCCFACNMNGSESMADALAQPLELCPLCLAKLCRLFRNGHELSPSSWAESLLGSVCPEVYPVGSELREFVAGSVQRLSRYSLLDSLVV